MCFDNIGDCSGVFLIVTACQTIGSTLPVPSSPRSSKTGKQLCDTFSIAAVLVIADPGAYFNTYNDF